MAAPLEFKRRVRLPEPLEEERPARRRSLAPLGVLCWTATVGLAFAISEGVVPIDRWFYAETPAVVAALVRPRRPQSEPVVPLLTKAPTEAAAIALEPDEPLAEDEALLAQSDEPAPSPEPSEPGLGATEHSAPPEPPEPRETPAEPAVAPAAEPKPAEPKPAPEAPSSVAAAGKSCEQAAAEAQQSIEIGKSAGPADLERHDYAGVLDRGSYFEHCGVPETVRIDICAAVQNGRAIGVTVRTTPGMSSVAGCVARAVRGLSFPRHPRLDVVRTTFDAQ